MHLVVRQLDRNYCNRVIYKSVVSITMQCGELYNDANYRVGVLSLAFPSTIMTTAVVSKSFTLIMTYNKIKPQKDLKLQLCV